MIYSYIRVSTEQQSVQHQENEINRYCSLNGIKVSESINVEISSRKDQRSRRIEELLSKLNKGDILIVTELSRLGRNTGEVITLIDSLIKQGIELRILKQNLTIKEKDPMNTMLITILSMFSEFERDIISQRTKESLQSLKDKGIKLGKPKGTIQKSKYDLDRDKILELKDLGLSYTKIIKFLGYGSPSSLYSFISKRRILTSPLTS